MHIYLAGLKGKGKHRTAGHTSLSLLRYVLCISSIQTSHKLLQTRHSRYLQTCDSLMRPFSSNPLFGFQKPFFPYIPMDLAGDFSEGRRRGRQIGICWEKITLPAKQSVVLGPCSQKTSLLPLLTVVPLRPTDLRPKSLNLLETENLVDALQSQDIVVIADDFSTPHLRAFESNSQHQQQL